MTVQNLIKILQGYPPNMEVYIRELSSAFQYSPVESIEKKEIGFTEEPDDKRPLSKDTVLILSDEI